MKDLPYIVCAFHTDDPIYNEQIARLRASLVKFDLPHDILTLPGNQFEGRWKAACRWKPRFVCNMLSKHSLSDILFMDADSAVLAHPTLFDNFKGDLGVYLRPKMKELQSAIVYVKNNPAGRLYAARWLHEVGMKPKEADQRPLQDVVDTYWDDGVIEALPDSYCRKFPTPGDDTVIGQYQASRTVRAHGRSLS